MSEENSNGLGTKVINNTTYQTWQEEIDIHKLQFYPQNPRVYHELAVENATPSQEEIFRVMSNLDSVKALKENISQNGGLTDPIIVQENTNIVLEGNSRLAAYRLLYMTSHDEKWEKIRCEVFPESITEEDIFILLGQYHVTGKTNWDPYEQASYLYRWHQNSRMPIPEMAKRLGLKPTEAKRMIETIKFMRVQDDSEVRHYSHYHEYLSSNQLNEYRQEHPELDTVISAAVQSGGIHEAADMRKIKAIATAAVKENNKKAKKQLDAIAEGKKTIYEAHKTLEQSGVFDTALKTLEKFRIQLAQPAFVTQLQENTHQDQVKYEIKKTLRLLKATAKKLGIEDE